MLKKIQYFTGFHLCKVIYNFFEITISSNFNFNAQHSEPCQPFQQEQFLRSQTFTGTGPHPSTPPPIKFRNSFIHFRRVYARGKSLPKRVRDLKDL